MIKGDRQARDTPDAGKEPPMDLSHQPRIGDPLRDQSEAFLYIRYSQKHAQAQVHATPKGFGQVLLVPLGIEPIGITENRGIAAELP